MFDQMKLALKARSIQNELKKTEIDAASRGNLVQVTVTGELKLKVVTIDETLLTPARKLELERLVQATMTEAFNRAQQLAAEKTRAIMKEMGVNIPGL
jgi:DNA-binding YbaB/EbfC family protein